MSSAHYSFCSTCRQDLIRDCPDTLGASDDNACAVAQVALFRRIVSSAAQAGLSDRDLSALLRSGHSIRDLLEVIEARMTQSHVA